MATLLVAATVLLAFANGANDNFKGFATVWGSGVRSYGQALRWATAATLAGGLASWWLAHALLMQLTSARLVLDAGSASLPFAACVVLAAAITVLLATRFGLPISTTHALFGGLAGAALAESGSMLHGSRLIEAFLLPLLLSPLAAALLSSWVHHVFHFAPAESDCACITASAPALVANAGGSATVHFAVPALVVASEQDCAKPATPVRWSIPRSRDHVHIFSALAICFARGVNDTPKLVAFLVATEALPSRLALVLVATAMALGGVLSARRVARTMSQRLTHIDQRSGLSANLVTATFVVIASTLGWPVATTHVAVGSIAGVGAGTARLNTDTLRDVLVAWLLTLPLAAGLAWVLSVAFCRWTS